MNRPVLSLFSAVLAVVGLSAQAAVVVFSESQHGVVEAGGVLAQRCLISAAAGANHRLLLSTDGQVFAEGASSRGQLGNGVSGDGQGLVAVNLRPGPSLEPIIAVTAGFDDSFALTLDGRIFAWGLNHYGQLGTGDTNELRFQPQTVTTNGVLRGKTVTAIAAGLLHCLALTSDGQVFAWGGNDSGQLGDGTTNLSRVPVAVDVSGALSGKVVTAIAAGSSFSLALTADGEVFGWGYNEDGELGDDTTTQRLSPVAVSLSGLPFWDHVTAVSAGANFGLALTAGGRVLSWGSNDQGQLGNGTRDSRLRPALVDFGPGAAPVSVVRIAAGASHSLALMDDGTAFAWGDNQFSQLGVGGVNEDHLTPTQVLATGPLDGVNITGAFSASAAHGTIFITAGPVQTGLRLTSTGAEFSLRGEPLTFYRLHRFGSLDRRLPGRLIALCWTDESGDAAHGEGNLSAPAFWQASPVPVHLLYRVP